MRTSRAPARCAIARSASPERLLYLVDASVYIFRAYFSIPEAMTDKDGNPVNALYGYTRFLAELLERTAPERMGIAFDESLTSSFRNEIYPDYKANRELPPPELERQLKQCSEITAALGLAHFASETWEADDIIGTLAARAQKAGTPVTVVTRDKDLAQLIGETDRWWDYAADRVLDRKALFEHLGVWPEQVADLLALAGDAVDNIPGVKGVGIKSATALLQHFGDLDTLYRKLDQVPLLRLRGAKSLAKKLADGREAALLSRKLTTIVRDAPLGRAHLRWDGVDTAAIDAVCDAAGFSTRLRERLHALDPG